jgi:hypothetical protein
MTMLPILKSKNFGVYKSFKIRVILDGQRGVDGLYINYSTVIPISFIFILLKRKCEKREMDSAFQKR